MLTYSLQYMGRSLLCYKERFFMVYILYFHEAVAIDTLDVWN
jgi:hypothetical protein